MKVVFWINTGFAGCDYEIEEEFNDDTPTEILDEYMNEFLIDNIDYGYYRKENNNE